MRFPLTVVGLFLCLAPWSSQAQEVSGLNIVVVEAGGAINNVRQRTARETIVQVEDQNHKPVAGAVVSFILPSQGAGGTFANGAQSLTVMTDAQGRAIAAGLRLNRIGGSWTMRVNASFGGHTASAAIPEINAVAAGAGAAAGAAISTKVIIIVAAVAGAAAAGGAVAATRGGGSSANSAVPTTISLGASSVGAPHIKLREP
jgi:hypothetical protein